jgi:hypothetical protein
MQPVPATKRDGAQALCHAFEILAGYATAGKTVGDQPRTLAIRPTVKNRASR